MEGFVKIKDYETYAVNPEGLIKDLRTGKLMKQYPNIKTGGYLQLQLCNENGLVSRRVHRLVALAFLDNTENLPEVDHIDRNRQNNNLANLRWVTHSDNQINKLYENKKSKYPKYIHLEDIKSKKNPNPSWKISIKNKKCKYNKRYQYSEYDIKQIVEFRNEILKKHDLEILD